RCRRLRVRRLTRPAGVALGAGLMSMLHWGGPTARAAATIKADGNEVWVPLIPAQSAGIIAALVVAWYVGHREAKRLDRLPVVSSPEVSTVDSVGRVAGPKRNVAGAGAPDEAPMSGDSGAGAFGDVSS